jgi:hypothetical protein
LVYRGTGASIFNECQMMGIQFVLTGQFHGFIIDMIQNDQHILHQLPFMKSLLNSFKNREELLSSALGGCVSACFTSPVELIMIQQQIHGGSLLTVPRNIFHQYGILHKGLMRAVSLTAMRDTIYVTGMLGVTPIVQQYLQTHFQYNRETASFQASMIGGIFAAIPSHPFDLMKTCMQGDLQQQQYQNIRSTFQLLWKQGGIIRFMNGCMWRTINITGTVYVANQCMNHLRGYVQHVPL